MRPSVDVVVPFRGDAASLRGVVERLAGLRLAPGDSILVVNNRPHLQRGEHDVGDSHRGRAALAPVRVVNAVGRATPAFARNKGAGRGTAEWLVFLDADTNPVPDLLDCYFDPPPHPRTALIGGGVIDEAVGADAPPAIRYAHLRGAMSQEDTFGFGTWGYPKSANVACRRTAFEAVGGFREEIRAAEDADLTYRMRAAGWEVERREGAAVVHFSRPTILGLVKQKALWGAGGAWLNRVYPGSVKLAEGPGLTAWALRTAARGLLSAIRNRDRDSAIYAVLHPLDALAWQFGRLLPNERPLRWRRR